MEKMIDRHQLVARHHPRVTTFDPLSPFTVGNGRFAFTADATGLQTFADLYEEGIPLHTQSQWGWHSTPRPLLVRESDVWREYPVHGRRVPYADRGTRSHELSESARWLRANPHRLDLGRIGLLLRSKEGRPVGPDAVDAIDQQLRLWQGLLVSRFCLDDNRIAVETACHPRHDTLAFRLRCDGGFRHRVGLRIAFPYGSEDWKRAADWNRSEAHRSDDCVSNCGASVVRGLDDTTYHVRVSWLGDGRWHRSGPHEFELWPGDGDEFDITVEFGPMPRVDAPLTAERVVADSADHWQAFWRRGGAVDMSESLDERAVELERRVVLSQYLTAVNSAGDTPPQETGLTCNSWFGKIHLEMHWWHGVHFALWNRIDLLTPSLDWYRRILPRAQAHAERKGYEGARWPKMVDAEGGDSPSPIATFLIWQQPHPIYLAELVYRNDPGGSAWRLYAEVVEESARFMASYASWNRVTGAYDLGPVLIPAQESYGEHRLTNLNPTYELAYWHWALGVAQVWRQRLGKPRAAEWDHIRRYLARPSMTADRYNAIATPPYLVRRDHPSMVAACGVLPVSPRIDPSVMSRTLDSVLTDWEWPTTWGWDYPMLAMTAARLGRPLDAVNALLLDSPKNVYLNNGHNYQDSRLTIYLPGNGALLTAVAMMACGWDASPHHFAPGFPSNGSWVVRQEGLRVIP